MLTNALFPPQAVQRNKCAVRGSNGGIDQAIVNTSSDVIFFQQIDAVLSQRHASGLYTTHEHVHLGFKTCKFLQYLALEVIVGHAHNQSVPGRFGNVTFFNSIVHKRLLVGIIDVQRG